MSIQPTTNNASIDWSSLLSKLDAASKAASAQGAGGVTAGSNVTITANRNLSGDPSYPIYFTKNIVV